MYGYYWESKTVFLNLIFPWVIFFFIFIIGGFPPALSETVKSFQQYAEPRFEHLWDKPHDLMGIRMLEGED